MLSEYLFWKEKEKLEIHFLFLNDVLHRMCECECGKWHSGQTQWQKSLNDREVITKTHIFSPCVLQHINKQKIFIEMKKSETRREKTVKWIWMKCAWVLFLFLSYFHSLMFFLGKWVSEWVNRWLNECIKYVCVFLRTMVVWIFFFFIEWMEFFFVGWFWIYFCGWMGWLCVYVCILCMLKWYF